jgi:SAM-dependent methyltransferase
VPLTTVDPARPPLTGTRCPHCVGALETVADSGFHCPDCGRDFDAGPYPGTLAFSKVGANFAQPLDAEILPRLIPALDRLDPPACSERVIERTARELGIPVGNPVWEGRADLARLLLGGEGTVALDIGCGFGTFATATARSAGHLFATDRSPVRVALTAARARAEGLDNLTAFETNGVGLPIGDGICDLVTIVGVLEWAGVGSGDADAAQRRMLAEVRRVLKPGGTLLLGIENRYAAHYFAGAREDHTDLRFSSLLPRPLADLYNRRAKGEPFETPTHSREALRELLRDAGLQARIAAVLPSYQQPRFAFDEADARAGLDFYVKHAFHATSTARRLAGRALLHGSANRATSLLPSFWAVATKEGEPPRVPGLITGSPYCDGAIKAIDWEAKRVIASSRRGGEALRSETLVDGWNGRRWVDWPLRAGHRAERRRRLMAMVQSHLEKAAGGATALPTGAGDEQARQGLELATRLDATDRGHCVGLLEAVPATAPGYREHGDLILNNIVIAGKRMTLVDRPAEETTAVIGRDVTVAVLDLMSVRAGRKQLDLSAGLEALTAVRGEEAAAIGRLLRAGFAGVGDEHVQSLMLAGVLRHCADHGAIVGLDDFLAAVAGGGLERSLRALGFAA